MTESAEAALVGRMIAGKYRIESPIGGGAMGAVYRARQLALDKTVAIKVMHPDRAHDTMYAALFQREAKAASRLDHPNSVRVLDFGQEEDGLFYIVMEYFPGRDLLRVLSDDWPLPAARIADLLSQALAALAVAHEMGMVHRDLKPENILVQRGTDDEGASHDLVKVCDFGIATFTEADSALPRATPRLSDGVVIGTPHYMSPEQAQGGTLDARTDIYSMGVILYQVLTARVPFEGKTLVDVVIQHVRDPPVAPKKQVPWVDPRLEAICLKAMKKKKEERYQSAREMRADLRAVLASSATAPEPPEPVSRDADTLPPPAPDPRDGPLEPSPSKVTPPPTSIAPDKRRRRMAASTALFALLAGLAGAGGFLLRLPRHGAGLSAVPPAAVATAVGASAPSVEPASALAPAVSAEVAATAPSEQGGEASREAFAAQPPPAPEPALVVADPAARTSITAVAAPLASRSAAGAAAPSGVSAANGPIGQGGAPGVEPSLSPVSAVGKTAADPPPEAHAVAPATRPASLAAPIASASSPVAAGPEGAAAAVTAAAPAARRFDPSRARVAWSVGPTGGGIAAGEVRRALARVSGRWDVCYQNALRMIGQRVDGSGVLHIATDDEGNVIQANVVGFTLSTVGPCIARAASVRVGGVDTGNAWADVKLAFRAEPPE